MPAGPEQISKDLSRRTDGVPATVSMKQGKKEYLHLYTYGYVLKLRPDDRGDFFWISYVDPFKLPDHSKLARACLLVHSRWRVVTHKSELPDKRIKSWPVLRDEWQRLQHELADQEDIARLDPQHSQYLDTIDAFNEISRDVDAQSNSGRGGFAYQSVRSADEGGSTTGSTYAFTIVGRAPKQNDYVQIGDDSDQRGRVLRVARREAVVRFDGLLDWNRLPEEGELFPAPSDIVHAKRHDAAKALRNRQTQHRSLLKVLVEHQMRPMRKVDYQPAQKLDPSQERAFRSALSVDDLMIVLGPPGTGKTRVITEMAGALGRSGGGKTLVTSYSNKAVDNVLHRIPGDVIAIRLGDPLKVDANVQDRLLDVYANDLRGELEMRSQLLLERYEELPIALGRHQVLGEQIERWGQSRGELASCKAELDRCRRSAGGPAHARVHQLSQQARSQQQRAGHVQRQLNELVQRAEHTRSGTGWWSRVVGGFRERRIAKRRRRLDAVSQHLGETREQLRLAHDELEAVLRDVPEVQAAQRKYAATAEQNSQNRTAALKEYSTLRHALLDIEPLPVVSDSGEDATMYRQVGELHTGVHKRIGILQSRARLVTEWHEAVSSCPTQQIRPELIRYADVIGTTCIGAATQKDISAEEFDLVIVDEAGQAQTSDVLIPLIRGRRAVLVGDHMQLPPVSDKKVEAAIEQHENSETLLTLSQKSLLETLVKALPAEHVVQLRTQRRMPVEIAKFISGFFYDGTLQSAVEPRREDALFRTPLVFVDTSALPEQRRHERPVNDEEKGCVNHAEAEMLNRLAEHYQTSEAEWALIVPYRAQLSRLKELAEWAPNQETVDTNLGTVDAFQGGERDVVLYGFTRSNKHGEIGFLDELRRLNVAFTRAKQRLILVGDLKMLLASRDPGFRALMAELHGALGSGGEIISYQAMADRLTALGS
ncbi:AAA domain-containing protein [Saccharopolyspora sp. WRP15-2]|uniref:AAA domain-containing protein n=1 Tax=Saccharopolyspora oryzae TaxID=2997343 RepID=A0ABT4UU35_9PSEU|nr:AAA domain-containing protein [Saccharopolyspora oryzae]MDA3625189.1 AAA domain-containing protein [Saccharopolyspora oryzae]